MQILLLTSLGGDDFTASVLYYLYMYMSLSTLMCLCLPLSLSLSLFVFAAAPVDPSDQAATYKLLKVMEEVSLSLMHTRTQPLSVSPSLPLSPSLSLPPLSYSPISIYSTHLISILIGFFAVFLFSESLEACGFSGVSSPHSLHQYLVVWMEYPIPPNAIKTKSTLYEQYRVGGGQAQWSPPHPEKLTAYWDEACGDIKAFRPSLYFHINQRISL